MGESSSWGRGCPPCEGCGWSGVRYAGARRDAAVAGFEDTACTVVVAPCAAVASGNTSRIRVGADMGIAVEVVGSIGRRAKSRGADVEERIGSGGS